MKLTKRKIEQLLDSIDNKNGFLEDLLKAITKVQWTGSSEHISKCLDSWGVIADLDQIKGLKKGAWTSYNQLKAAGII